MLAAIGAGGANRLGARIAALNTLSRQATLFALGLATLLAGLVIGGTPTPPAPQSEAPDEGDTCVVQALTCLPRSAATVAFRNEAAANAAAARNVKEGLSAAEAQAAAEKLGADGEAARLCGEVQSGEVSPLGKHLAAVRLTHPRPGDGKTTVACLKMAQAFL
jgi:hypothetical protein